MEIAETDLRELFPDQFHQLFYAHEFSCLACTDLAQVPVGVDVEIPPLDHGEVAVTDEFPQRLVFFHAVGHAGENKIIDTGPAAITADYPKAFHDVVEGIIVGAVICFVNRGAGGVEAYADGIHAAFAKGADCKAVAADGTGT